MGSKPAKDAKGDGLRLIGGVSTAEVRGVVESHDARGPGSVRMFVPNKSLVS